MNDNEMKSTVQFLPDQLNQWDVYKKDNYIIWIAGDNTNNKYNYLIKELNKNKNKNKSKNINKGDVQNIIKGINDHFGIVVIAPNWSFAAVDCARTCPVFWKKINHGYIISSQAKVIADNYVSDIDNRQLLAFQMSGYTINEGTLWKDIKNLNPGHFIFIENQKNIYIEKYFFYKPWSVKNQPYEKFKKELKVEIKTILKNLIKNANGRTIAIPLSAGLDSRLVASGLKELKYNNVKCYSYGLKNNYESHASEIIAQKLGYKWTFVEITQSKAKDFYLRNVYKNFISNTSDGCATTSIQGLYAIDYLLRNSYLCQDDIIVNGNSGDFITGGHIPLIKQSSKNSNNINLLYNDLIEYHFNKHYSLWDALTSEKNKNIIKEQLLIQIKKNSYDINENFMSEGIVEFIEYENRQAKFVNNCQRIYEGFGLKWQLPLWNKSFMEFWSHVPLKYKINQKLYKDVLREINMGDVWGEKYDFKYFVSPKWVRIIRFIFKACFMFLGKEKWHKFEKKYLEYWTDNICGESIFPYRDIIKNKNGARHYVSWYAIICENMNIKSNWQNIKIDKDV
jgi:asparagine synthase (glutamine-hydrolysing)